MRVLRCTSGGVDILKIERERERKREITIAIHSNCVCVFPFMHVFVANYLFNL